MTLFTAENELPFLDYATCVTTQMYSVSINVSQVDSVVPSSSVHDYKVNMMEIELKTGTFDLSKYISF